MYTHSWIMLLGDLVGFKETRQLLGHLWPELIRAFFSIDGMEPLPRRELLHRYYLERLLTPIMDAIDPWQLRDPDQYFTSPADDTYLGRCHDELLEVNLKSPEFDERFRQASVYRMRPLVKAKQFTYDDYYAKRYPELNLKTVPNPNHDLFRYHLEIPYIEVSSSGKLFLDTHPVEGEICFGEWLVYDPELSLINHQDSRFYVATMPDQAFWQHYQSTSTPGQFRSRRLYKAFRNPTHTDIKTSALGTTRCGNARCWFIEPFDTTLASDLTRRLRQPVSWWWFDVFMERRPLLLRGTIHDWRPQTAANLELTPKTNEA